MQMTNEMKFLVMSFYVRSVCGFTILFNNVANIALQKAFWHDTFLCTLCINVANIRLQYGMYVFHTNTYILSDENEVIAIVCAVDSI